MAWGLAEKEQWFKQQKVQRSYAQEVVSQIQNLRDVFNVRQYAALSQDPSRYPLFILKSKEFSYERKTVLITGGVHGYETSGVQGALAFLSRTATRYKTKFNIVCAPCISPWSYETINRWNTKAIDPNRSFYSDSPAEESRFFLQAVAGYKIYAHFDLHETTDTDNTVFRPALAARDSKDPETSEIPDGFYVVGDSLNPQPEFQKAIIEKVREVTHIAPPDAEGKIIGEPLEQEGVINYPLKKLFLCAGFSDAEYTTTTEVYPDSPKVTDEICIQAQVAAIEGGLQYLANRHFSN